jgi:hypothetical protein
VEHQEQVVHQVLLEGLVLQVLQVRVVQVGPQELVGHQELVEHQAQVVVVEVQVLQEQVVYQGQVVVVEVQVQVVQTAKVVILILSQTQTLVEGQI